MHGNNLVAQIRPSPVFPAVLPGITRLACVLDVFSEEGEKKRGGLLGMNATKTKDYNIKVIKGRAKGS
ncbi:hypothetical protein AKJ16_DCAP24680 [Drosera capensis]